MFEQVEIVGSVLKIERGGEIVAQGLAAHHCFEIVSGCARSVQRLEDGRRQVGEFLLPGDVFGLDETGEYAFAAEAVTEVVLRRLRRSAITLLAEAEAAFAQRLLGHLVRQAQSLRLRLMTLGRMTAAERTAAFLLEMADRLETEADGSVALPMSRADMADYLGLTIETVSRCLSDLKRRRLITLRGGQLVIANRAALLAEAHH